MTMKESCDLQVTRTHSASYILHHLGYCLALRFKFHQGLYKLIICIVSITRETGFNPLYVLRRYHLIILQSTSFVIRTFYLRCRLQALVWQEWSGRDIHLKFCQNNPTVHRQELCELFQQIREVLQQLLNSMNNRAITNSRRIEHPANIHTPYLLGRSSGRGIRGIDHHCLLSAV